MYTYKSEKSDNVTLKERIRPLTEIFKYGYNHSPHMYNISPHIHTTAREIGSGPSKTLNIFGLNKREIVRDCRDSL